jgi:ribosomal protein S18 acetylase RimI-like enzyme
MDFTIRKFRDGDPSDFEAITKLDKASFSWETSDDDFRDAMKNGVTLIADTGEVAAFVIANITNGQPYIWDLVTAEEWRGNGLARALLEEINGHFQEQYSFIWLHVDRDNPAQKLYFDLGYRVQSVEQDYYGEQKHGLIMVKRYK